MGVKDFLTLLLEELKLKGLNFSKMIVTWRFTNDISSHCFPRKIIQKRFLIQGPAPVWTPLNFCLKINESCHHNQNGSKWRRSMFSILFISHQNSNISRSLWDLFVLVWKPKVLEKRIIRFWYSKIFWLTCPLNKFNSSYSTIKY